jgi:hypothetical protein
VQGEQRILVNLGIGREHAFGESSDHGFGEREVLVDRRMSE